MKTRLLNLWGSVRVSLWFIPGLMVSSAIVLAFVLVAIDRKMEFKPYHIFVLYTMGPGEARSVLSTIAGSMITVAGVVFSITIVALTLASSQFGPRLLRNFMKDISNQVVLGTFIATFIYCLLVLRSVRSVNEVSKPSFVPDIAVSLAMALALISAGILIYFIHHVSVSIQADHVITSVYHELLEDIKRLFPKELECELEESEYDKVGPQTKEEYYHQADHIVASQSGYLQSIDNDGLLEIARKSDLLIYLQHRPGEFIVADSTLVVVRYKEQLEKSLIEKIAKSFIVGQKNTPEQNVEFAIHQLVEIALRALSPGINDPFTAISCIDWLCSALCFLTNRAFPSPYYYDDEGKLRVIAKIVTFAGITNAAFDQIRQYGISSIAVTIRLLETLKMIAIHTRNSEQRQAILRQANMIVYMSHESLSEKNDREDVKERYQALLNVLNDKDNAHA